MYVCVSGGKKCYFFGKNRRFLQNGVALIYYKVEQLILKSRTVATKWENYFRIGQCAVKQPALLAKIFRKFKTKYRLFRENFPFMFLML